MKRMFYLELMIVAFLLFMLAGCSNTKEEQSIIDSHPKENENSNQIHNSDGGRNMSFEAFKVKLSEIELNQMEALLIKEAFEIGLIQVEELEEMGESLLTDDYVNWLKQLEKLSPAQESSLVYEWMSYKSDEVLTRIKAAEYIYNANIGRVLDIKSKGDDFYILKGQKLDNLSNPWMIEFPYASYIGPKANGAIGEFGLWEDLKDLEDVNQNGNASAVNFTITEYDKKYGDKLLALFEDQTFRPMEVMTRKEGLLLAMRYYNSILPKPQYISVTDVGPYDETIITQELLKKAYELPDATSSSLPTWKGFNLSYMGNTTWQALSCTPDDWVTEADIKAISETGANFIRLWISFSRYEGPAYGNLNQVNQTYLRHLDEIIAWGLKYGVHIQLSCTYTQGMDVTFSMEDADLKRATVFTDQKYLEQATAFYKMFARRYSDLPNNIFSINLMNECNPENDQIYAQTFAPIIEAIRSETPNRLIVADVHGDNINGGEIAKLGVALSFHLYSPREFCVVNEQTAIEQPEYYNNMTWPYQGEINGQKVDIDGKKVFDLPMGIVSLNELIRIAEANNVGIMVGEFGVFEAKGGSFFMTTIPRAEVFKMLEDVIAELDKQNIPWAANWVENYSVALAYPVNLEAKYVKLEGSSLYIDEGMQQFFRKIISDDNAKVH